ncbi:MAG TPA: response regulator [Longimicrobium sp.]|jgi:signal transduction histidine kinase|uniref:sensor histidine kinase n=1 Tax=Longimicrobium sp. TaxID=2029185 RepID=UPI002EDB0179
MSDPNPHAGLMQRGAGEHVLIAEDDASAARVLRLLLEQAGYRVTVAADGEQAMRILDEQGAPDLLLLDWMLPRISGLEICHAARQRWDALRLPILMVTAKTDPESVYAAFDAGASDYVGKPFRGAELRARIDAHLRTRRLMEERARMEGHLRERDKLFTLGLLAGGVAHDLNNPLAVISAHAQILLRRAADEDSAEQLRDIIGAVDRCSRIVNDMLNFARRHPVERGPVDVADVLRATVGMRERKLSTSGVDVQVQLPDELPLVAGDWHQLQQVFLNVLVNAEQALGERGRTLRVSAAPVSEPAPSVVVELWNDGPPIPPDVLPHIFDPLFTTKAGDEGTGLGLFICRRIIREHGGWMDVRSGDDGTAFAIRLPVYPD